MNGVEITGDSMENTEVQLLPHTTQKTLTWNESLTKNKS